MIRIAAKQLPSPHTMSVRLMNSTERNQVIYSRMPAVPWPRGPLCQYADYRAVSCGDVQAGFGKCGESWMKSYCLQSCNNCPAPTSPNASQTPTAPAPTGEASALNLLTHSFPTCQWHHGPKPNRCISSGAFAQVIVLLIHAVVGPASTHAHIRLAMA